MLKRTSAVLTASLAVSFGAATPAFAQAFYLQEQSVRGAGRVFSGEVADTGSQSLWWNPAAIGGATDGSAALGASGIIPHGKVVNTGTVIVRPGQAPAPVTGEDAKNPITKGLLPSGSIAYPLTDRVSVGLAVTSPFSFTTDYDANSWTRYSADKTALRTIDIQPSIGVAATDWLRVGVALNVENSKATLSNALPNLSPLLPDGSQKLKGSGWDLGWSAGLQLHNAVGSLGIAYKSSIRHKLKGDLEVAGLLGPLATSNLTLNDVTATFRTPNQVIVGGRFKATDQLTLNAQYVHFGWSKFDAIRLGAPVNQALPENYRNSWSLAGGLDYAVSPDLTLRAGVQRATTPTRNGERDARVPDSNRWNVGVGGSLNVTPAFTIDAAANYVDFANAAIERPTAAFVGTPAQTVILTSGELRNARALVLSLGGAVRF
ncbi:outer membrane protein transport protein [Sphingomonas sp. BN140010]|uniref:Outer membrane protein transport protein n=1 Tax=Sphingomonas arvum TaxID=2992113 RepID=A0ABT3JFQ9_9SPHN|nr:outer membrane protein transport protein [Sphingomonas sp. BN140010]MCW3797917.1 outer membrane protein transport protein [Sphingomonas sp. BN140010]